MFTCLKDYRTHPTSLEAALAIIIAVRSPRSLLALSAVKPLVAAYCSTAARMYCAHQPLYTYCAHQLHNYIHVHQIHLHLAIIFAVRSPRSLLALSAVKPLVAAYCSTAAKMYCTYICAHQLYNYIHVHQIHVHQIYSVD